MIRSRKNTKKGLSLDQHKKLGCELQAMRNQLVEITVLLGHNYPIKARVTGRAENAYWKIDELRSDLENALFRENAELDPAELDKLKFVYHPQAPTPERKAL